MKTICHGYWKNNPSVQTSIEYDNNVPGPNDFITHNTAGPATIIYYDDNKTVFSETWCIHGMMHRSDGPAYMQYYLNGQICCSQFWYEDWIPEDFPFRKFTENGVMVEEEYTLMLKLENMFPSRKDGSARTLFDSETGTAFYKEFVYHKPHDYYNPVFDYVEFMYDNFKVYKRKTAEDQFDHLKKAQDYSTTFYKVEIFDLAGNLTDIKYEMLNQCYDLSTSETDSFEKTIFNSIDEIHNYFLLS